MSKYDKEYEMLIQEEETLLEDYYTKRLAHLDMEVKVRTGLGDKGFTKIEPDWAYENTPEYIEHQKNGMLIAVEEEKARITASLNNIKRNRLQRKEIAEMKQERENKE